MSLKKGHQTMKIKLIYLKSGRETFEEYESRVNEFMATHDVVSVQYQEATYGNYEDMDTTTTIMVVYREKG